MTDAEREAQIRDYYSGIRRDPPLDAAVQLPFLLRLLDEAQAEAQRCREMQASAYREQLKAEIALDEAQAEIARLTAPPGASVLERINRAFEDAKTRFDVAIEHWHPSTEQRPVFNDMAFEFFARAIEQAQREARAATIEEAAKKHDQWAVKAAIRANDYFKDGKVYAEAFELIEVRVHEAAAHDLRALAEEPESGT